MTPNGRYFKVTKPQSRQREKESYRYLPATVSRALGEMWSDTKTDTMSLTEKEGTPTKETDNKTTLSNSVTNRKSEYADGACSKTKIRNFALYLAITTRYADLQDMLDDEANEDENDDGSEIIDRLVRALLKLKSVGGRLQIANI